jgi:poly(A) polymerase Pap1
MDNNYEIYRYLQDEYMSPIVASHQVSQKERQNLAKEFLSALKITNNHDKNAKKWQPVFLVALAQRFFGTL